MCSSIVVGWLGNDVELFCIDKIHIDRPNRMEDQPNLAKVKPFELG